MKISDLLYKNTIELNLKAREKGEAIRELVDLLYRTKKIKDPEKIISALLEREKTAPITLGNGAAIPHTTVEGIQEPIACLAISQSGIDFESPDDKRPVRVIFLFLSPPKRAKPISRFSREPRDFFGMKNSTTPSLTQVARRG